MSDKIILCVPGNWSNHSDLVQAMLDANTGYIYAGMIAKSLDSDYFVEIEEYQRDTNVGEAFRALSLGRFDEAELSQIDNHQRVIYAICEGGSLENVVSAMKFGKALLKAGGLGIKIETTGVSHTKTAWLNFDEQSLVDLFTAFVVIVQDENNLLSCGMHNFGKPDGIIEQKIEYASYTLQTFLLYLLGEEPEIHSGQTFSVEQDAEKLKIEKISSSLFYEENDSFSNPHDIWCLKSM